MHKCEFCTTEFATKSYLNNHMKTAKYCLKIQCNISELFMCEYCDKVLSTKNRLQTHLEICGVYIRKKELSVLELHKQKIIDIENQLTKERERLIRKRKTKIRNPN